MAMKISISFCLALLYFPLCHAQCDLNVPNRQLVSALSQAGLIAEADQSKFTLQDVTYLCFVRSSSDNTKFDQVRVSMLYTYDTATNQSAQATFSLCLGSFVFVAEDVDSVTQDPHLTEDLTREGCQDCLDSSTFARPTFCRREYYIATRSKGGRCSVLFMRVYMCMWRPFLSFLQWMTPVMQPHVLMVGTAVVLV